jgi:DNA-binding LacI/PurR family transcriptional regulator
MIINKESPVPQYFQLQTWLMEQVDQGIFKPGDQIPTEKELCEMTGLARATVRQAIGNLASMGYLERQRRRGTFVRDRGIEAEKRTIIGICIPDIRTGYAPELARGVEDEAALHHHSLILCNTDDSYVKADHHADRLVDAVVSGVILIPTATSDDQNRTLIQKFARRKIPVVLADRTIPAMHVDHVTTDNYQGAYRLTEYLIQKGHRKIAMVVSTLFSTERARLEGYKAALEDHHISIDPSIVVSNVGAFSRESYREPVEALLKRRGDFTAVFAGHDRIALLFYSMASEMGLSIPKDFSLVGYDDLPFTTISLTTMHQPIYEMGQESLRLIMARIRGEITAPKQVVLTSHLVERSSVQDL